MALAFCNVTIFSRSRGHSAVAGAAYRSGAKIRDEQTGKIHNYGYRKNIAYTEIFAPSHAPRWVYEQAKLWNEVHKIEKQSNSQLAREVKFALQSELTLEQNIQIAKEIAQKFAAEGMVADLSIHNDFGNLHAHIMLTMRPFEPDGSWGAKAKKEYVLDDNGDRIRLKSGAWKSYKVNTTHWDNQNNVELWRQWYADTVNKHFALNGHDIRIDPRSYERQGIDKIPGVHLGSYAHQMEQRGIETKLGNVNRQIKEDNRRLKAVNKEREDVKKRLEAEKQEKEKERDREKIGKEEQPTLTVAERYERAMEKNRAGQGKEKEEQPLSYRERYERAMKRRLVRDPNRQSRSYKKPDDLYQYAMKKLHLEAYQDAIKKEQGREKIRRGKLPPEHQSETRSYRKPADRYNEAMERMNQHFETEITKHYTPAEPEPKVEPEKLRTPAERYERAMKQQNMEQEKQEKTKHERQEREQNGNGKTRNR